MKNRFPIAVLVLAFFPAVTALAQSSDRFHVRIYQTEQFGEVACTNACPDNSCPCCPDSCCDLPANSEHHVVFSIDLNPLNQEDEQLKPGEIFLVMGEILVRQQSTGAPVVVSSRVYLGTSPIYSDADANGTNGANLPYQITEGNGENLNRDFGLVDQTHVKVGTFRVWFPDEIVPLPFDAVHRKYVNITAKVGHDNPQNHVSALHCGSRLTVLRLSPYSTPTAVHGWEINVPHADNGQHLTISLGSSPTDIYKIDLDDPPGQNDPPVDLLAGDILLAMGEAEATFTGSGSAEVYSQVVLVDSANTTTLAVTKPNAFSLAHNSRDKSTAVKAGAFTIPAPPSQPAGNHWKYVKLVGWQYSALQGDGEVLITPTDDDIVPPTIGQNGGRLAIMRLRHAQDGIEPTGFQRYDQLEYNEANNPTSLTGPVELICRVGLASGSETAKTLFKHPLANLNSTQYGTETIIAISELEATNGDYLAPVNPIKALSSQLVAVSDANPQTMFDISFANIVKIGLGSIATHHGISPKVGIKSVPASATGSYTIKRVVSSDIPFDGNCEANIGSCNGCSCPGGCTCTYQGNPVDQFGCDIVTHGTGRAGVLRASPLSPVVCSADCYPHPSGGVPDGTVNIDDLLTVLGAWGMGRGTWGDVNDDGIVNIDDLLAVINAWGPCPANDGGGKGNMPSQAGGEGGEDNGPPQWLLDCVNACNGDGQCLFDCIQAHGG